MTRPRTSAERELFGILGAHPDSSAILRSWNGMFRERGMDASMHRYPASAGELPERLSEMLHFDRRLYLVGPALRHAVLPLLDRVDDRARVAGKADVVVNRGGVFTGFFVDGDTDPDRVLAKLV